MKVSTQGLESSRRKKAPDTAASFLSLCHIGNNTYDDKKISESCWKMVQTPDSVSNSLIHYLSISGQLLCFHEEEEEEICLSIHCPANFSSFTFFVVELKA
jgi:hypothetical protein